MGWPDLCERLLTRLETSGADTTAERSEFAVLVAECGSSGCKMALSQEGRREEPLPVLQGAGVPLFG